jgi:hypothetical protein
MIFLIGMSGTRRKPLSSNAVVVSESEAANDEVVVQRSKLREVATGVTGWVVPVAAGYFTYDFFLNNVPTSVLQTLGKAEANYGGLSEFIGAEFASAYRVTMALHRGLAGNQAVHTCKTAGDVFWQVGVKAIFVDALAAELTVIGYNLLNKAAGRPVENIDPAELVAVQYFGTQATRLGLVGIGKTAEAFYSGCRNCFFSKPKLVTEQPLLADDLEAPRQRVVGKV